MYWAVGFLLISNLVLTVMWIMQCQPVHGAWYGPASCMGRSELEAIILTQALISILSDFILAAFPIFYFWRLQVDFKTKVGLWLLMGLGVITGVCCIVRTVLNNESLPDDATYNGIVNWIWRLFEVQFGIIAACIPALRPLYGRLVARWRGEDTADSNIKFLHSEKQGQRWIENRKSRNKHSNGDSSSDDSHSPNSHGHQAGNQGAPKQPPGDDMGQDLVREGIITPNAPVDDQDQGRGNDDVKRGSSSGLQKDMLKYGIADESPSSETNPLAAPKATPGPTSTDSTFDFGFDESREDRRRSSEREGSTKDPDFAQRGEFGQEIAPADVTKPASGAARVQRSMLESSTDAAPAAPQRERSSTPRAQDSKVRNYSNPSLEFLTNASNTRTNPAHKDSRDSSTPDLPHSESTDNMSHGRPPSSSSQTDNLASSSFQDRRSSLRQSLPDATRPQSAKNQIPTPQSTSSTAEEPKSPRGPGEELMAALKKDGIASFGGEKNKRRQGSASTGGSGDGVGLQGVKSAPAAVAGGIGQQGEGSKGDDGREGDGRDKTEESRGEGEGGSQVTEALRGPEMWDEVAPDGHRRSIFK